MDIKCRNCKYSRYYEQHGYVCTNSNSDHISDFMDGNDWCKEFTEKEVDE